MCSPVMLPPRFLQSALFITGIIVCGSCQRQPTRLWFDDHWANDYVANDCKVKQQIGTPCRFAPAVYVQTSKDLTKQAFVTDAACHGLSFRVGLGEAGDWILYIDQEGDGPDEQNWRLFRRDVDDGAMLQATDKPGRLIHKVCTVISGGGGEVGK